MEDLHIAWLTMWIHNVVFTPGQQVLYPLSHLPPQLLFAFPYVTSFYTFRLKSPAVVSVGPCHNLLRISILVPE